MYFEGVCVLVPAYNEAVHIGPCVAEVLAAFPGARVLVIDNNSSDDTAALARAAGAEVLHEDRQGKGFAVTSGIRHALSGGSALLALHDADCEYSASHLARLVEQCQAARVQGAELIMGVGLREVMLGRVLWRSVLANFVARLAIRVASGMRPPEDILTGARVMSATLASKLFEDRPEEESPYRGFELETALTRRAMALGGVIVSSRVRYTPRIVSEKKIKAWDMFGILKAAFNG